MLSNIIHVEIDNEEGLQRVDASKVQFFFLGEDCVWFRAFSLCGGEAVCFVVTMDTPNQQAEEKRKEMLANGEWESYYLGMGHIAYMRECYYPDFVDALQKTPHRYPAAFKAMRQLLQDRLREPVEGVACAPDEKDFNLADATEIKVVKLHRSTPFCSHAWYELTLTIDGKACEAIYSSLSTDYVQIKGGEKVALEEVFADKLRLLTGEREDQRTTRRLLGLDGFAYGYADWTARLSRAQVEERLSDFSKVSFEDVRRLPEHWLVLLPASAMYDWLHCSGFAGDVEASEFVSALAKKSKIKEF